MPGELQEVNDFSLITHQRQTTVQNTYFNERFGRSDFEKIDDNRKMGAAVAYILKYIEKSGERLIYGGDLPTYFESDVMDDDILAPYGIDDKKAILADDFTCMVDGEVIGKVSPKVVAKMPKVN